MSAPPGSFSVRGTGAPIRLSWVLETKRDLWTTWAAFADTDRFNRAGGLGHRMEEGLDSDGRVVRQGRMRELGIELRWIEHAFDFERPDRFRAERQFLNGPARGYTLDVRFETIESGTRIHYLVSGYARWAWMRPITWLIFMLRVRPSVGRALRGLLGSMEKSTLPQPAPMAALKPEAALRLERAMEQIEDRSLGRRLEQRLKEGTEPEQDRLDPHELAHGFEMPVDAVLDACLRLVKAGVLSLRWDLLCPSCYAAKVRLETLTLDGLEPHCPSCNIRYDAQLADNVVVSFRTTLREIETVPQCVGNPSATPHFLARQDLQPGETRVLSLDLEPGRYRIRQLDQLSGAVLEVGEGDSEVVFNLEPHSVIPAAAELLAGRVELRLRNAGGLPSRVAIEDATVPIPGVTLAQLLGRSEAMGLVPEGALPRSLEAELRHQAVVTTECLGSPDKIISVLTARVENCSPVWLQPGHRTLTMGFPGIPGAMGGLTRIIGCTEFCSALSLGTVMEIKGIGGPSRHTGPALEQSMKALAISLPGGASLAQECAEDPEILASLAMRHPVQRALPGPSIGGRKDLVLDFVAPHAWRTVHAEVEGKATELLGRVIRQRYRIDDQLGEGGFGVVFSAVDLQSDSDVVVKVLHPQLLRRDRVAQSFFNEARSCMSLSSPFIVRMTDFGHSEDGFLFAVMEQLLGRSLDLVPTESRSPELVCGVCLDALRGLAEVHAADMVHRDIKPGNIFVQRGASGRPRGLLIDFGIALNVLEPDPSARPGELVGSAPYISPEQLDGTRPGPTADIYAMGMVLYRCLAGAHPFEELPSLPQLMKRAAEAVPPIAETSRYPLPEDLAALIDRALDRDPQKRPSTAREFSDLLKAISW